MPNHSCMMLGRRLRAARRALCFDQEGFAAELGLSLDNYVQIEQGRAEPDLTTIAYAAEITGKSPCFFLQGRCCADSLDTAPREAVPLS